MARRGRSAADRRLPVAIEATVPPELQRRVLWLVTIGFALAGWRCWK